MNLPKLITATILLAVPVSISCGAPDTPYVDPEDSADYICADVSEVAPADGLDYHDGLWRWDGTIVGVADSEDEDTRICVPVELPPAELLSFVPSAGPVTLFAPSYPVAE